MILCCCRHLNTLLCHLCISVHSFWVSDKWSSFTRSSCILWKQARKISGQFSWRFVSTFLSQLQMWHKSFKAIYWTRRRLLCWKLVLSLKYQLCWMSCCLKLCVSKMFPHGFMYSHPPPPPISSRNLESFLKVSKSNSSKRWWDRVQHNMQHFVHLPLHCDFDWNNKYMPFEIIT